MTDDQPESGSLRAFMTENGVRREYGPRARLHHAGEKFGSVLLLEEGWIARVRTDQSVLAAYMALHIVGDVIGADTLFGLVTTDDLVALTSVRVVQVALPVLRTETSANASLALELAGLLAQETVFLREALFAVGRQPSDARLCTFFVQTLQRQIAAGLPAPAATTFSLPLTQADLAAATGLTPIHVNRVLRRLGERNWLEFRSSVVNVSDLDALQSQAQISTG